jgi:hypothetical protein
VDEDDEEEAKIELVSMNDELTTLEGEILIGLAMTGGIRILDPPVPVAVLSYVRLRCMSSSL